MFENILWSVDPEDPDRPPLPLVRSLDGGGQSRLLALAVLEPFDHLYAVPAKWSGARFGAWRKRRHSDLRRQLRALLRPAAGSGLLLDYRVADGSPASTILSDVREEGRDLILIRTQTETPDQPRIGAVVEELLLRSPVALCCFREVPEDYALSRLLVPTDLSENSFSAFETAVSLAEERGADVTLLHMLRWPWQKLEPGLDRELHAAAKRALKKWRASRPHLVKRRVTVREEVLRAASPAEGILARARDLPADLVVLAAHGWTGVAGVLFGSTARRVVRDSPIPVLVTRTAPPRAKGGDA
jgi:nucleotide-binding universal stress UspA family protein